MSAGRSTDAWRVRVEGSVDEGRAVDFSTLAQQIADGVWQESDEVRDPATGRWGLVGNHPQLEEFLSPPRAIELSAEDDPEMDITPMIDVTFQLIIFFMITATFVVQKTIDMPRAEATEEDARTNPTWNDVQEQYILVEVKRDQTITVDNEPVGLAELPQALQEVSNRRDLVEMVLKMHDEVSHELFVNVLDAAAGAEIEQVHLVRGESPTDDAPQTEASKSPAS